MCQAGDKKFNDWCRLDSTKELIKVLENIKEPKNNRKTTSKEKRKEKMKTGRVREIWRTRWERERDQRKTAQP